MLSWSTSPRSTSRCIDEPKHPRFGEYVHQHTKDWSAIVSRGDAFIFVVPEYNYGFNAAIKNALDYLNVEWRGKAVGFVSYGGVAAGTRAMQMLKPVLAALKLVPLAEAVNIPFVQQFLDADRKLQPNEIMESAATAVLDELVAWSAALHAIRSPAAAPASEPGGRDPAGPPGKTAHPRRNGDDTPPGWPPVGQRAGRARHPGRARRDPARAAEAPTRERGMRRDMAGLRLRRRRRGGPGRPGGRAGGAA